MNGNSVGDSVTAYIGLGSNMGRRKENLDCALEMLRQSEGVEITAVSAYLNTAPVGYTDQPDFLNAAAEVKTHLPPLELLILCNKIEASLKRERIIHWGPRTIDLDILLYGNEIINTERLVIPHPRMHEREFVLKPLNEIASQVMHPVFKQTVGDLFKYLKLNSQNQN